MSSRDFTIEAYGRFFAGGEIRPGNTATFMNDVDLSRVEAARDAAAEKGAAKPPYTAFVVKAVALALESFPYANRRLWGWRWIPYLETRLQRFNRRDIAVVVERDVPGTEGAVFRDIIRDADRLSLDAIAERLAAGARADAEPDVPRFSRRLSAFLVRMPVLFPRLWPKERGSAAMVCPPARDGVDAITAAWASPLGFSFGAVEERPVVKEGRIVACPTFTLTLNFDRRVMAGAQGARFFHRVVELLETAGEEVFGSRPDVPEGAAYTIEPFNRYVSAHRKIVENEIRPEYTACLLHEADLSQVEALRAKAVAAGETRPSYTAYVAKAVARAVREFPEVNARVWGWPGVPFFRTRVQRFHRCDVAVAVERNVPGIDVATFIDVIRDVDRASLAAITASLQALATGDAKDIKQWREFSTLITRLPIWLSTRLIGLPLFLPALWLKYRGGAVLVSSPAKYGVDSITATWAWALGVSFGMVKERPFVQNGSVVSRRSFALTLNFDRRLLTVAQAARFFRRVVDALESAEEALAEPQPGVRADAAIPREDRERPYTIEPSDRVSSANRSTIDFERAPRYIVTFFRDVDLTEIGAIRDRLRAEGGAVPSYTTFIAEAAALALKDFPGLWAARRVGAVLVTSPSEYGIDALTGAWSWPLGVSFGAAAPRPVVRNGEVVPCPTFTLTLTWDRRVMAGAQAARFFRRMTDALEHAESELAGRASGQRFFVPLPRTASKGSRPARPEGGGAWPKRMR